MMLIMAANFNSFPRENSLRPNGWMDRQTDVRTHAHYMDNTFTMNKQFNYKQNERKFHVVDFTHEQQQKK